jgi:hypothetical protein
MAVAASPLTTLKCKNSLTTELLADSNTVNQPASQGNQYGPVHCPTKGFGGGIIGDSFTVPDSGDTVGTYTQYFSAGSIHGKFDLSPEEAGPISNANFESQSWSGTITIAGGTGIYNGITAKKGSGTMTCTSPDSVHLSCTEKIKLKTI